MTCCSLIIEVRLLHQSFHGRGDAGDPEWPPSPARLFQALVAAAGDRRTDAQAVALAWLERQAPPSIDVPVSCDGSPRRTYVPNNDADQHREGASRILKVVRPIHLPDGNTIRYAWAIAADDRPEAETIANLAKRVRALGWGIDLAIGHGKIVDHSPASGDGMTRWLPQPAGATGRWLRVSRQGTLAGLDADHEAARNRIQGDTQTLAGRAASFERVPYRTEHDLLPRPMRIFRLLDEQGESQSFWPSQVRDLAAMLRHQAHLAAKRAGWNATTIGGYVCGHGENGHPPPEHRLSYLPIPSIGHRHSDGFIRRVALVESPGGDGRNLHELADRLIGQWLIRDGCGSRVAALAQPAPDDGVALRFRGLLNRNGVDRAVEWTSVTPVVLPGFNARGRPNHDQRCIVPSQTASDLNGQARKAHKLLLRTLAEANIPAALVAEIWLQKLPLWPNLPHATKFARPTYLQHRPSFHMRLRFKQPVYGPITLGAGRFVGFGTFAASAKGKPHARQRLPTR